MSIKTDNLDPKFANEDPTTFYDLIFDINSFRHLQKVGNNDDWGWNVLIKKDFNYDEAMFYYDEKGEKKIKNMFQ